MKLKLATVLAAGTGVLAACGPSGGATSGPAGDATTAIFAGEWKVNAHIVAPWFTGPGFSPEPDGEILEKTLTISETGATGPAALTCEAATLAVATQPLSAMFEGKVTDAHVAKASLGIEGEQTPALTGCNALTYYMVGDKTMLLGLNDIVYQFAPPTAEEPAAAAPATPAAPAAPTETPKPQ